MSEQLPPPPPWPLPTPRPGDGGIPTDRWETGSVLSRTEEGLGQGPSHGGAGTEARVGRSRRPPPGPVRVSLLFQLMPGVIHSSGGASVFLQWEKMPLGFPGLFYLHGAAK